MRESTRLLKKIAEKDKFLMHQHNNNKADKRTEKQNEQSRKDKVNHYATKWEKLLTTAETSCQKALCAEMISRAKNII